MLEEGADAGAGVVEDGQDGAPVEVEEDAFDGVLLHWVIMWGRTASHYWWGVGGGYVNLVNFGDFCVWIGGGGVR